MIITQMALPRRTFLRGLGATLALPLLDAMVPALSALAARPRAAGTPPRLRLHPDGDERGALDAARRGPDLRAVAVADAARAVICDHLTRPHQHSS